MRIDELANMSSHACVGPASRLLYAAAWGAMPCCFLLAACYAKIQS